jgi:hypothetical protein
MDYVLYVYVGALCAVVYAAIWSLAGQRTKVVLTLGAYAYHPRYVPPSGAWRRSQIRHRERNHATDFPGWHEYFADTADRLSATPGIDSAPTVVIPVTHVPIMAEVGTPAAAAITEMIHLVRAQQSTEEYGAEHWGDLLSEMNTEERAIYSAELVEVYEATKAPERDFLDGLDAAIDRFTAAMERLDRRTAAAFVGVGANLARAHGGPDRWSTGQFPVYEPTPEPVVA